MYSFHFAEPQQKMKMDNSIKEKLKSNFPDIQMEVPEKERLKVSAEKEKVLPILSYLKGNGYDHLALISCVDWMEENEFELVYIISAYLERGDTYTNREKLNILIKTRIPRDKPEFSSVISVFENAEPYEREIHELFGIKFAGHPRLIPLFLERDYETPPFRKDFDTRQYVKEVFDKIPSVEDKINPARKGFRAGNPKS